MNGRLRQTLAISALGLIGLTAVRHLRAGPRHQFCGQCVVITGGARGLGLELARQWAAEGAKVAICSRTPAEVTGAAEELRQYGGEVYGEACDVTQQEQVNEFLARVCKRLGPVDVLVNNAGIIQAGPLDCMTSDDFRQAMNTHFWGPLYAIQAVLPDMRERRSGRIVNISSIGGKISVPHLLPYCVSKFALTGLSEGLRTELAADGISVTTVCPGMMRTGSPRNASFKGQHQAEYAWFSIASSLPFFSINSGRAAARIVEACRAKSAELLLSFPTEFAVRGHAMLPAVSAWMLEQVNGCLPNANGAGHREWKGWQSFSKWSPSWLTTLTERAAEKNGELQAGPGLSVQHRTDLTPEPATYDDEIDQAGADSFPASDPPSWTRVVGNGAPA